VLIVLGSESYDPFFDVAPLAVSTSGISLSMSAEDHAAPVWTGSDTSSVAAEVEVWAEPGDGCAVAAAACSARTPVWCRIFIR
jgi:hypothetical protein